MKIQSKELTAESGNGNKKTIFIPKLFGLFETIKKLVTKVNALIFDHKSLWDKMDEIEKDIEESNKVLETWLKDFAYELQAIKEEIKKLGKKIDSRTF